MEKKTFKEVAALWLTEKQLFVKKSTLEAYRLTLRHHLFPVFGEKKCILQAQTQTFVMQKLQEGLSPSSIRSLLVVLRMIAFYGNSKGMLETEVLKVTFPTSNRTAEKTVKSLTVNDQRKLVDYLYQHLDSYSIGILLSLSTGMRIGELCALRWEDTDLRHGIIYVRQTLERIYNVDRCKSEIIIGPPKTQTSYREIPLSRDLCVLLQPFASQSSSSCYVLTGTLQPTEPRAYRNRFATILRHAGVTPIHFHALRHSFASRCIECHCDYKTVSVLLGHKSLSTTMDLYVHPTLLQKRQCIQKTARPISLQKKQGRQISRSRK